jgi:hypothetical protein
MGNEPLGHIRRCLRENFSCRRTNNFKDLRRSAITNNFKDLISLPSMKVFDGMLFISDVMDYSADTS